MASNQPGRGRATQRTVTRTATRRSSRSASKGRSPSRRPARSASRSSRPASKRSGKKGTAPRRTTSRTTKRPARKGMGSKAVSPRPGLHSRHPIGQESRYGQSRAPEPLEFVEVPIRSAPNPSYTPNSYAPRGEQMKARPSPNPSNLSKTEQGKAKPKRRGFFGSLFGG
jgi:hypothetical protein